MAVSKRRLPGQPAQWQVSIEGFFISQVQKVSADGASSTSTLLGKWSCKTLITPHNSARLRIQEFSPRLARPCNADNWDFFCFVETTVFDQPRLCSSV
jgi:hypothetical protein